MDAVKFLKEKKRMCDKYANCDNCPMNPKNNKYGIGCSSLEREYPEKTVAIVEKWSAEHPVKTNQSEFLILHPNADIREGVLNLCPRRVDLNSVKMEACKRLVCSECKKKYWLVEVEQ